MVTNLAEKYRPACYGEVVAQEKAVARIAFLREHGGLAGRVILFVGPSGAGKTTLSRLVAAEVSEEHATFELDAADLDIEAVRRFESLSRGPSLGGAKWCVTLNEVHRMRGPIVSRLLTTFEMPSVQRNMTFLLTTTLDGLTLFEDGVDAGPFASRAVTIPLAQRGLCEPFAERARQIAQAEGLDGQPYEKYVRLMKDCRNNLRLALNRIAGGEMAIA